MQPAKMVKYVCMECLGAKSYPNTVLDLTVDKILKSFGMQRLLETIIDKLGNENYEIKLKEDIARALLNYKNRYDTDAE